MLHKQAFTLPISLGPRVMRADTAAVAVLALVNAVLGDWR
jgi:16S rRNA (uracil1498-N3)-methyltransferase